MLTLGYLTYTTANQKESRLSEGKAPPTITDRMLNPGLIEPKDRASPAGRDPFEVASASYLNQPASRKATSQPASAPATKPAAATATQPAQQPPPPLTEKLTGVFFGPEYRLAMIGEKLCKVGSTIGGDDPRKCWRVESIEENAVVVGFGKVRRVLRIASRTTSAIMPATGGL